MLAVVKVEVYDDRFFLVVTRTVVDFSLWTSHKTASPELYALGLARWVWLKAHTVDGHNGKTVGHGVSALHGGPCLALPLLFFWRVAALIADGGGVDEQVGSGECHETGCLRIPLVPAHQHAQAAHTGVDGMETEVAGSEIELFVIGGVIRDVHLAVFPCDAAVAVDHHGGVVVEAWSTPLEKGGDNHYAFLTGEGSEEFCRWSRDGFCQVEIVDILHLTEVKAVVEFLQYDELSSTIGKVGDAVVEAAHIVFAVSDVVLLQQSYFQFFHDVWVLMVSCWGNCMVRQWSEPCWRMTVRASSPMMAWSGKACWIMLRALASLSDWA